MDDEFVWYGRRRSTSMHEEASSTNWTWKSTTTEREEKKKGKIVSENHQMFFRATNKEQRAYTYLSSVDVSIYCVQAVAVRSQRGVLWFCVALCFFLFCFDLCLHKVLFQIFVKIKWEKNMKQIWSKKISNTHYF